MKTCNVLNKILAILFIVVLSAIANADQVNGLYAMAYGNPSDPAVIFLHGGPGYNSFSFEDSNAGVLAARGYYVVVFDQRGSGRSASAPLAAYTFKNATDDVQSILDFYKIKKPIIIGHSYGGTLAIKYAEAHPDNYQAIVLADAPLDQQETVKAILDHCQSYYQASSDATDLGYINELSASIFSPTGYTMNYQWGGFIFAHATNCRLYSPKSLSADAAAIWSSLRASPSASLLSLSQPDPFHGFIDNEKWLSINVVPELHNLTNVYAIFGDDDGLFNAVHFKEIKTALPANRTSFVDDASHNIFIDQRNVFLDFVDKVRNQTK